MKNGASTTTPGNLPYKNHYIKGCIEIDGQSVNEKIGRKSILIPAMEAERTVILSPSEESFVNLLSG